VRTLMRTFLVVAAYLVGVAAIYWFLTEEDAGTALLLGTAATLALVAVFLIRRRGTATPSPPEDDPDAEPAAAAGTPIGSFPFTSAWPVILVAGLVVTTLGILYTVILIPMGLTVTTVAIVGLMRESPT